MSVSLYSTGFKIVKLGAPEHDLHSKRSPFIERNERLLKDFFCPEPSPRRVSGLTNKFRFQGRFFICQAGFPDSLIAYVPQVGEIAAA